LLEFRLKLDDALTPYRRRLRSNKRSFDESIHGPNAAFLLYAKPNSRAHTFMVLHLRAILTWLGFLFKTVTPLIKAIVRRCIFLIRKLCLQTTQLRLLQTLGSHLLASCHSWVAPRKNNARLKTAEFTAASIVFSMPTPHNAVPAAAQPLQANPAGHSSISFNSQPPSLLPTGWDPAKFKPSAPKLWQRYKGRPLVYAFFVLSSLVLNVQFAMM
jgi:hypothetical protein